MRTGRPATPAAPGNVLLQAAVARQSGALVVDATPGGTLYLTDGNVTYAESPSALGVGELLTRSGRLARRSWQAALEAGAPGGQVAWLLVEQGHLTHDELELSVLGAIYDAAYFVLRHPSASLEFVPGATHWLGCVTYADASTVARESRRRARLLDEIFPLPLIDTASVTPVARPPVEQVTLTTFQWELLIHADGQRTPADLAQLLGRAGYATVQELRVLARLGLIEVPRDPDLRAPELRAPELRAPELRAPELRAPELTDNELTFVLPPRGTAIAVGTDRPGLTADPTGPATFRDHDT